MALGREESVCLKVACKSPGSRRLQVDADIGNTQAGAIVFCTVRRRVLSGRWAECHRETTQRRHKTRTWAGFHTACGANSAWPSQVAVMRHTVGGRATEEEHSTCSELVQHPAAAVADWRESKHQRLKAGPESCRVHHRAVDWLGERELGPMRWAMSCCCIDVDLRVTSGGTGRLLDLLHLQTAPSDTRPSRYCRPRSARHYSSSPPAPT